LYCSEAFALQVSFFFFSSRRRHTRFSRDWSSDVCSSDLDPAHDVVEHIDRLWSELERQPRPGDARSSLLPLPHPYIVPGGRYDEIYYWDSYFTMLGLVESGRLDLVRSMVANFRSEERRVGK